MADPRDDEWPRDAVITELEALGRVEAVRDDDLWRAQQMLSELGRRRSRTRRIRAFTAGGGAVLAIAATLVLTWAVLPRLRPAAFEVDGGEFLAQQGRLHTGDRIPVGEWIDTGDARACLRLHERRVCGEPGTRLRVRADDGAVEIDRGRVEVTGDVELATPAGSLRGDGFTVELDDAAMTVISGQVELADDAGVRTLEAGSRVGGAPEVVARNDSPNDDGEIEIVDTDAGPAPSDASTRPRSTRRVAIAEPPADAGEMLATARALASAGKLDAAAKGYTRLIDAHPRSSEAHAAWVSLGRIQAARGRHRDALAAFGRYLSGGAGALAEEAHWGRIQALHALGRTQERDKAIAGFATAYPKSVYLPKARRLMQ